MPSRYATKVIDRDKGWKAMRREVEALKHITTEAGVLDSNATRAEGGRTNVQLAADAEFGVPSRNIPRRPFLSEAVEQNRAANGVLVTRLTQRVVEAKITARQAMDNLGGVQATQIKAKLIAGPWAYNAPATVAAKGSDRPLRDTDQMLEAIAYRIVTR